jgi:hypothetical protein
MTTESQQEDRQAMLDAKWQKYWEDIDARNDAVSAAREAEEETREDMHHAMRKHSSRINA